MSDEAREHPYAHVPDEKCYEWMLAACASLEACRQSREDGLISTIIQISSAAILAIPGLFFSNDAGMPSVSKGFILYLGISSFSLALLAAMLEQHLSAAAHAIQVKINYDFYGKKSTQQSDEPSRARVRYARNASYFLFGFGLLGCTIGMLILR